MKRKRTASDRAPVVHRPHVVYQHKLPDGTPTHCLRCGAANDGWIESDGFREGEPKYSGGWLRVHVPLGDSMQEAAAPCDCFVGQAIAQRTKLPHVGELPPATIVHDMHGHRQGPTPEARRRPLTRDEWSYLLDVEWPKLEIRPSSDGKFWTDQAEAVAWFPDRLKYVSAATIDAKLAEVQTVAKAEPKVYGDVKDKQTEKHRLADWAQARGLSMGKKWPPVETTGAQP